MYKKISVKKSVAHNNMVCVLCSVERFLTARLAVWREERLFCSTKETESAYSRSSAVVVFPRQPQNDFERTARKTSKSAANLSLFHSHT